MQLGVINAADIGIKIESLGPEFKLSNRKVRSRESAYIC